MLPPAFVFALQVLSDRLAGTAIDWAIGASCSLALHGIDVDPHDVDLDTTAAGAYLIEQRCCDLVARPVQFVASPQIRSHWGALAIDEGSPVEKRASCDTALARRSVYISLMRRMLQRTAGP